MSLAVDPHGYAALEPVYVERGWKSVFPLPKGCKHPPPKGVTGANAKPPSPKQREAWRRSRPYDGVGLYLPDGLLAVDVDNYAKGDRQAGRALEVIAEVESRAGCAFPPTWTLRNRNDGSEKRIYRVPEGKRWRSNLGPGVELVHHGHRYVHIGLNPHTGNYERWHDPAGKPSDSPPRPGDLTELSDALALELIRTDGGDLPSMGSAESAARLLDEMPAGLMSPSVRDELEAALEDLSGESGSRHDVTRGHVRTLVMYGHCGVAGAPNALGALRDQFVEAVWADPNRGSRAKAEHEYDELRKWAGRAVAGCGLDHADRALQRMILEALGPGGGWHPDTPKPWERAIGGGEGDAPSWAAVDIGAALSGASAQPPAVLARVDGACLFYRGKDHSVHGESESGKSWLVQCAAAETLLAGESVLYIDFEDDAGPVAERLIRLGVQRATLLNQEVFVYVHPEATPTQNKERNAFRALLEKPFSLVVVDGVTNSMDLYGLSGRDADDVAKWQRQLPRAFARRTGGAVVCIDHVAKDSQSRGRFALGSQHKMAGLSGAAYLVEPTQPFAVGQAGMASVRVGKDRPGHVRKLGGRWRKADRTQHIANFVLDSTDADKTTWALEIPENAGGPAEVDASAAPGTGTRKTFRPTWFMEQVSRYWEETEDPAERTHNKTVAAMCEERRSANKTLHRDRWRKAISHLVEEGFARTDEGARGGLIHNVLKPYRQDDDPASDTYSGVTEEDAKRVQIRLQSCIAEAEMGDGS